jgi:hypothetical protein
MITKFRIHFLIFISCIIFFLIQEIFSIEETEETSDQGNNTNQDDKIRCNNATCYAATAVAACLIVGGSVFAIFRHQKRRLRQKTGDLEEIVTMKCKQMKIAFNFIIF